MSPRAAIGLGAADARDRVHRRVLVANALAADRAGIRFSELALDSSGALQIQRMATELTQENVFFPSIAALSEEIPQHLFEKRGGIESDYYKKNLAIINDRINQLTLYKTNH